MTEPQVNLVLASASPARRRLLKQAGVEPSIWVSDVDEEATLARAQADLGDDVLEAGDVALLLARAKAEAVARQAVGEHLVLGADSVLELDADVHGKPADAAQAISRWRSMRGRSGVLHTGHWLIDDRDLALDGTGATFGATASTVVHFASISDAEIEAYVATGEPLRVAGAFTLDGLGAPFVDGVEGDPSSVVGLSLPLLRSMLEQIGITWADLREPQSHY